MKMRHPLKTVNFTIVNLNNCLLAFSYETLIGVCYDYRWWVCENDWGPTTGKHLRYLDDGTALAIDRRLPQLRIEEIAESVVNGEWIGMLTELNVAADMAASEMDGF